MIGKGFPLLNESIDGNITNAVYSAVLHEKVLKLKYSALLQEDPKQYRFHPYGIILRQERSYLIGRFEGYDDVRQVSLSRIISAEQLSDDATVDKMFRLKDFINDGKQNLQRAPENIEVKLWITSVLATLLQETPLSNKQTISPYKDDYMVTAYVENSDELRHWLLSMVNHATVISPNSLRNEIKETLENGCN